jgi:SAM-dependent methyltransferase
VVVSAGGRAPTGGQEGGPPITPGAHWQHEELVHSFVERRRILIPLLELQEDVLARLFSRSEHAVERFLDIGAGAGAMSQLMLSADGASPGSHGVLVDFSQPMLARAAGNLAEYAGRWQAVTGDLNDPAWGEALPGGRYDAVVSGLAIHHLPSERKRALFAEVFDLLEPGGMFVNMDYVAIDGPLRGLFDEEMLASAVRAERESGGTRHEHEVDLDDDDDWPDTVEDQLRWLRAAGFQQVEVHFKWAEAAIYGGMRPAT